MELDGVIPEEGRTVSRCPPASAGGEGGKRPRSILQNCGNTSGCGAGLPAGRPQAGGLSGNAADAADIAAMRRQIRRLNGDTGALCAGGAPSHIQKTMNAYTGYERKRGGNSCSCRRLSPVRRRPTAVFWHLKGILPACAVRAICWR